MLIINNAKNYSIPEKLSRNTYFKNMTELIYGIFKTVRHCFVFRKAICISDGESAPNLLLSTKAGKAVNNKPIMVRTKADGGSSSASRKGNIEHVLHERIQVLLIIWLYLSFCPETCTWPLCVGVVD